MLQEDEAKGSLDTVLRSSPVTRSRRVTSVRQYAVANALAPAGPGSRMRRQLIDGVGGRHRNLSFKNDRERVEEVNGLNYDTEDEDSDSEYTECWSDDEQESDYDFGFNNESFLSDDESSWHDESSLSDESSVESVDAEMAIGEHIIIPYKSLCEFVKGFVCAKCGSHPHSFQRTTIGIATQISHCCKHCKNVSSIEPEKINPPNEDATNRNYWRRINAYAQNVRLVLITQLIGGSATAGATIGSLLGLSSNVFQRSWSQVEDHVGKHILALTDEILKENIAAECEGVQQEGGYTPVDVSGDGAWQSGRQSHDSPSGHAMLIGKKTDSILAFNVYSKLCAQCSASKRKGVEPPEHACSKNYDGSSKGMESAGLHKCVVDLHEKHNLYVRTFVMDNDTATKAYLQHSNKEKLDGIV